MNRKCSLLVLACLTLGLAHAKDLELIEGAYEAMLPDVVFPLTTTGTVSVRMCTSCNTDVLNVNTNTAYIGESGPVSLPQFLAEVAELKSGPNSQSSMVGVFYNLQTNQVTRISLHPQ